MKNRNNIITMMLLPLGCFALCPLAQALTPPPDGGYPGGNTAEGQNALGGSSIGGYNTAIGFFSLAALTDASFNTGVGAGTLLANIGANNTAAGAAALLSNTTGNFNTAIGVSAGGDLTTGDNNIDIGFNVVGVAGESNTVRIGNNDITDTFIRGISGATTAGGVAVFVNSNGHLGTTTSSARFKDEIRPMGPASEAILALKPVTFRYKKEIDPQAIPEFGLVAEEVAKVNPDLIIRDKEGKPYTVRYEQINAMLLNEFLKEHRKVEQQDRMLQKQDTTIARQQKQIDALAAGLQKVSAQVEMSKPATKVASNHP